MSDDIVTRLHRFALRSNLRISIEAADEIERLQTKEQMWRSTCSKLIGMMLPYSLLMRENEREELTIILQEAMHDAR